MKRNISKLTLRRMTYYLAYLKSLPGDSPKHISAPTIAKAVHLGVVQVRKDLAQITRPGQNKVGRNRQELISDIEKEIGLDQPIRAVLLGNNDFLPWFLHQCGDHISIAAHFDTDKASSRRGRRPLSELAHFCIDNHIQIAILNTAPDLFSQIIDPLAQGGVRAIWNFSSVPLERRDGMIVQNENLMSTLGLLSYHAVHTAPDTVELSEENHSFPIEKTESM